MSGNANARPRAKGEAGLIFDVRSFGADGGGTATNTCAIQQAIDAASAAGGGVVYFPPGEYLSGTLRLRSAVTIELPAGATLTASRVEADFDPAEKLDYESHADSETTYFHHSLLCGEDLVNVAIVGRGTIDGNGRGRGGPKPLALKRCVRVTIRDVMLKNAPNYNVSLLGCADVQIEGVRIVNGFVDGIDVDCCRDVRIASCRVESRNDAICLKTSRALGPLRATENVTVTDCVLTTTRSAFKLGSESAGDFRNIIFSNSIICRWPETLEGKAESGVALHAVDGGSLERISISNIVMDHVCVPIFVRMGLRGRGQKTPRPGVLREVSISQIVAAGADLAALLVGVASHRITSLSLRHLRVSIVGGGHAGDARREIAEGAAAYPRATMLDRPPAYGLYCRHAEGLTIDDVQLRLENPDERPALVADHVSDLNLLRFVADPAAGEEPIVWLRNVSDALLHGSRARPGTKRFLRLSGAATGAIRALANDLSEAKIGFELEPDVRPTALASQWNLMPSGETS